MSQNGCRKGKIEKIAKSLSRLGRVGKRLKVLNNCGEKDVERTGTMAEGNLMSTAASEFPAQVNDTHHYQRGNDRAASYRTHTHIH